MISVEQQPSKKRGRPPKSAYLPGGDRYVETMVSDEQSLQSLSIDTADRSYTSDISDATTSSSPSSSSLPPLKMSTWSNKKAVFGSIFRTVHEQLTLSSTHAHFTDSEITASAYRIEKLIFQEAFGRQRVADGCADYANKNTIRERVLRYLVQIFPTITITPISTQHNTTQHNSDRR